MNKNRKQIKRIAAAGICTLVTANTVMTGYAAGASAVKDENVYASLSQDGTVNGIYVVNEFTAESEGEIQDYGDYTSLQNLTDQSELDIKDGCITAELPKGKFYYQGNMDSGELPWDISIQYFLDGKEIEASQLAGESGNLKIVIHTGQNPDAEEAFFENYLLQATVILNTEKCSDIQAEGATAGNVGVNRQLLFTIMPGEEEEIEIEAKVEDFEMEGITFQGVPMALGISGDMLEELGLDEQTKELTDAVARLDDGAGELKQGTAAASSGALLLADGVTGLTQGAGLLYSGGSTLTGGTSALLSGMQGLQGGIGQYTDGVEEFADGIGQYVSGVEQLAQGAEMLKPLESLPLVDDAVNQMYQAVAVGDKQQGVPSLQAGAGELADGLRKISEQVKLLENSTDKSELEKLLAVLSQVQEATGQLSKMSQEISAALEQSAAGLGAVGQYHQAVLDGLNDQVDAANQILSGNGAGMAEQINTRIRENHAAVDAANAEIAAANGQIAGVNAQIDAVNAEISGSAASVNAQIDNAIFAIEAAASGGTLDADAANQAIASLQASRVTPVTVGGISQVSEISTAGIDTTGNVQASGAALPSIQMPAEDAQIQATITGLTAASTQLKDAAEIFSEASAKFKLLGDGLAENMKGDAMGGNAVSELSQALAAAADGADGLKTGVDAIGNALGTLSQNTASFQEAGEGIAALNEGFEMLCKNNQTIRDGRKELTGAKGDLTDGTSALVSGSRELHQGALQLSDGISALHQGTLLLDVNTTALADGLVKLDEGTGQFKDGTWQFRKETENMDEKIEKEMEKLLDEMSGEDFEPVSFTSDKNTNIGLVQFAITTEGIQAVEEKEETVVQEEKGGFAERLKQLFQ